MTELLTAATLFFSTDCDRYLISPDPTALEQINTTDLEQFRLVTKARIYLYGHPLDTVALRLVEHELFTREVLIGK